MNPIPVARWACWLSLGAAGGVLTLVPHAQGAETVSFTRLASWPGYAMGMVRHKLHVTDSTIWLGNEHYNNGSVGFLVALSVSNPASPTVLSSTATGGGHVWAFEGPLAYVLSESFDFLEVYDLADPRQPVRRSRTNIGPGYKHSMMGSQGYVWILSSDGVEVLDVRNPSAPEPAGSLQWTEQVVPSPMLRCGDFGVVMTCDPRGTSYVLRVIDVRNPAQPVETGSLPLSMGATGSSPFFALTVLDDYVYYLCGRQPGETVYHVRAAKVSSLGTLEPTAVDLRLASGENLHRVGNYLYATGSEWDPDFMYQGWVRVIDATDRLNPTQLSTLHLPHPWWTAIDLVTRGGQVFVSVMGHGGYGLLRVDATNPALPVERGTVWRNWGPSAFGLAGGPGEPIWRVLDGGTSRIRLFGAADLLRGNPAPYREWDLPFVPGFPFPNPDLVHVLFRSNHVYALSTLTVSPYTGRLDVFDVAGAGPPVLRNTQQVFQQDNSWGMDAFSIHHRVKIDGDELYLSYHPGTLDIHSLSNPASPQFLSTVPVDLTDDLEIHDGCAYLLTGAGSIRRLAVVDVRDPANPSAMTICREFNSVTQGTMIADGDLLYVVYFRLGLPNATVLEVFDLANPLSPTSLSSTRVAENMSVFDLAILDRYAILAGQGLLAVDISNPSQPKPLGAYKPFPEVENAIIGVPQVRAWQNHLVVQSDALGIEILDVGQVELALGRLTSPAYSPLTGFSFIFRDAVVGRSYRIQRSSSLTEGSWLDWQSFTYTEPVGLMDVGATGAERRFYRAVSP